MNTRNAAEEALNAIDAALEAVAERPIERTTSAGRFSPLCSFLFTSIHHGRAAMVLVASDPQNYFPSVSALFRCQLEAMVRGYFFAYAASDEEFEMFGREGKLPLRRRSDGKKSLATISLRAMCREATAVMGGSSGLESLFEDGSLEPFHAATHAGNVIMLGSLDADGNLGFTADARLSAASLSLPVTYAHAALVHLISVAGNSREYAEDPRVGKALQRMADLANCLVAFMKTDSDHSRSADPTLSRRG